MSLRTKKKVKTAVTYFCLILVGVLFLLPALWLVLSTFNRTDHQVAQGMDAGEFKGDSGA